MDAQARLARLAWEALPQPRSAISVEIVISETESRFYNFGPLPPRLWPEDVQLAHQLGLELSDQFSGRLHHRDIVGLALRRMANDLESKRAGEVIEAIEQEIAHRPELQVSTAYAKNGPQK